METNESIKSLLMLQHIIELDYILKEYFNRHSDHKKIHDAIVNNLLNFILLFKGKKIQCSYNEVEITKVIRTEAPDLIIQYKYNSEERYIGLDVKTGRKINLDRIFSDSFRTKSNYNAKIVVIIPKLERRLDINSFKVKGTRKTIIVDGSLNLALMLILMKWSILEEKYEIPCELLFDDIPLLINLCPSALIKFIKYAEEMNSNIEEVIEKFFEELTSMSNLYNNNVVKTLLYILRGITTY